MSPIDAIGYAFASFIALPAVVVGLSVVGILLSLLGGVIFAIVVTVKEWASIKWHRWKARK